MSNRIFFRFNYQNFHHDRTSLLAQLYRDGDNSPLGNKHVIVRGSKGDTEFVFDLARNGTRMGKYRIALLLDGKVIGELRFSVG